MKDSFSFQLSVEAENQTGRVLAAYIQVREGKSAVVKEYADGNVFADYDRAGRLIGIEILGPCTATILDKIAKQAPARRFVRGAVPTSMLLPV